MATPLRRELANFAARAETQLKHSHGEAEARLHRDLALANAALDSNDPAAMARAYELLRHGEAGVVVCRPVPVDPWY